MVLLIYVKIRNFAFINTISSTHIIICELITSCETCKIHTRVILFWIIDDPTTNIASLFVWSKHNLSSVLAKTKKFVRRFLLIFHTYLREFSPQSNNFEYFYFPL